MLIDQILQGNNLLWISKLKKVHLTFLDPPFNQGKDYRFFNDELSEKEYWNWMTDVVREVYNVTEEGGAVYFMQREKNTEQVLRALQESGWTLQNLIIWKKMASAVPNRHRYNKAYQIIAFATKGERPRVFNKLRVDYPLAPWQKKPRENGVYLNDVWDDIRELTSGYFAGDEPLRDKNGKRIHLQQSPLALLLRIILSSTLPGDLVLDPFAGSGTTLVTARQLGRHYLGIEIDPNYVELIKNRMLSLRDANNIYRHRNYYRFTENLDEIWYADNSQDIPVSDEYTTENIKACKQQTLCDTVEIQKAETN